MYSQKKRMEFKSGAPYRFISSVVFINCSIPKNVSREADFFVPPFFVFKLNAKCSPEVRIFPNMGKLETKDVCI